jgi:hypothetical protein
VTDVWVIVTIVVFFAAAALLTRALDRVIAVSDTDPGESGEGRPADQASDAAPLPGRPT